MRRITIPLIARVLLALVIVGLVPFLTTAFLLKNSREAMVYQTEETHLGTALALAQRVGAYLDLYRTIGRTAVYHPNFYTEPDDILRGLLQADSGLAAAEIYRIDERGSFLDRGAVDSRRSEQIELARQVDDARLLVFTRIAGRPWLRLRVPLPEQPEVSLNLVIDAAGLEDALITPELGDEADLILADRQGDVLAGNVASLDEFPPSVIDKVRSAQILSGADEYELPGGRRVICAYADVAGTSWSVLSKQPPRLADERSASMWRTALQAFGGVIALMALFAFGAQRSIVDPIQRLVTAQRRLAGTTAEAEADGDEIQQLEQAFEQLERNLNDREALSRVFLGRYQVVEVLGVGAMGTVFRGWDPKLQRPIALKTIKISQVIDDDKRQSLAESLLKEAITLARLQHPHIVTVFDVVDRGEAAFIAMELIEGMSLESYRWQERRVPVEQVMTLGVAVLRGLAAAHRHGFVHHDVKPANILLGFDGSIKVADFGIAELLSKATQHRDTLFGTPGYVAPEALHGQGYTERSDIYAVGVVLYECLTGLRPFQGRNPKETMMRTIVGEYTPLRRLRADVPPEVEEQIDAMLAKNPENRPTDAIRAADLLEDIVAAQRMRWQPPKEKPKVQGKIRVTTKRAHATVLPTGRMDHTEASG